MITSSFDPGSAPVFGPQDLNPAPAGKIADTCIVTFSKTVIDHAMARFDCREAATIMALNGNRLIYTMDYKGKTIAFCLSPITSAGCGTHLEEVMHLTGASSYVLFGSCGALSSELTEGRLIIPTEAYRDEGFSYHYAPAAEYITVKNAPLVTAVMEELGLPHVSGRCWTTDALFRETRDNVAKRKAEGCIAVDMECSGIQALCDFKGYEYYTFFYTGDLLDAPQWEKRILCNELEKDHQLSNFLVALEIAARVGKTK